MSDFIPSLVDKLPPEIFRMIIGRLSYEEIAQKRLVSKKFNDTCGDILTSGFTQLLNLSDRIFDRIHSFGQQRDLIMQNGVCLCRNLNLIWYIRYELRLMYIKFRDCRNRMECPFFPGKLLDSIFALLRGSDLTNVTEALPVATFIKALREVARLASQATDHLTCLLAIRDIDSPPTNNAPGSEPQLKDSLLYLTTPLGTIWCPWHNNP